MIPAVRVMVTILTACTLFCNAVAAYDITCTYIRDPRDQFRFNRTDIQGLAQALTDNSFDPPLDAAGVKLGLAASSRIGWGGKDGYQICLQNNYLFSSTIVSLKDISDAVNQIATACCVDTDCEDGRTIVNGDTGSNVRLLSQPYGARCCGMFWC